MTKVSNFFGITIEINPLQNYLSHVIASYSDYEAMFSAGSGGIMDGEFPNKQARLVTAWILIHDEEIEERWRKSLEDDNYIIRPIEPLQ